MGEGLAIDTLLKEHLNDLVAGAVDGSNLDGEIEVDVGKLSCPFEETRNQHRVDAAHRGYRYEEPSGWLHTLGG